MSIKPRIAIGAIGLTLVMAALIGLYVYMSYFRVDTAVIDHIATLQKSPNVFVDPSGEIEIDDFSDLGYIVKGSYMIDIHYGRQVIEMNKACFESIKFRNALKTIGIKVLTHEDEDGTVQYKVTYWGKEINELSKVT